MKAENTQGKILQICHSDGNVKIDETRIVENGILAEGIVQVRILYIIGDDEMPFYSMETMIPFSHVIEAEESERIVSIICAWIWSSFLPL